jgi:hypothetical protein
VIFIRKRVLLQLRQDDLFYKTLEEAKFRIPSATSFLRLEKLDMK